MQSALRIETISLSPGSAPGCVLDMSGRCAFAVCTKGQFTVRILNEIYTVSECCLLACMPFVNIEVVGVEEPVEVMMGYIMIENALLMITQWINSHNLLTIQNNPLARITRPQFQRLFASIGDYQAECSGNEIYDDTGSRIQSDIIDLHGRLIVAQVLRAFFSNMPMQAGDNTQKDIIFQRFMLSLYSNFREHRDVGFYAARSGVSVKYFSTVVRKVSGKSPSDWIETVVVGEAKTLLKDPSRSIKDIATSLNFPDAPTFTKYFTRSTSLTPRSFRRLPQ